MRRPFGRRVAVTYGIRVIAPVGVFTMPILAQMTPLAAAAHDVVLHEYQVAFPEAFACGELATRFGDVTDILVPHDHRSFRRRCLIHLDVGSTNAADFHLQQCTILRNIWHGEIANLSLTRTHSNGRQYSFHRLFLQTTRHFVGRTAPTPLIWRPARTSSA